MFVRLLFTLQLHQKYDKSEIRKKYPLINGNYETFNTKHSYNLLKTPIHVMQNFSLHFIRNFYSELSKSWGKITVTIVDHQEYLLGFVLSCVRVRLIQ